MKHIIYTVTEEYAGQKIRTILKNHFGLSAAVVTQLKKNPEGIKLNEKEVFTTHVAKKGDILEINLVDKKSQNIEPVQMSLDILYENEDILVLNKPRNMPTHPSCNHHGDTLANGVMYYYKEMEFTFRVITRLDRDTSGVVLVAKNKIAASYLTQQMIQGKIHKTYYALCHGRFENICGIIDEPISRVEGSAILRSVNPDGKRAITKYEVLKQSEDFSLVKLSPVTGRTHQIRVHLSYIGHPIYGDDMYGSPIEGESVRLHCSELSFKLPDTGEAIIVSAPLPDDMTF